MMIYAYDDLFSMVILIIEVVWKHGRDFDVVEKANRDKRRIYKYEHSSLHTIVERVFDLLKARLLILKNHVSDPIFTQVKILQAVCFLHNFIINHNPNGEQFPFDDINESEVKF
ncbi:hypothetical protein EJ110_NYTH58741 [Nymphaea thermarum]|nr:hypothetical protein EJ110_NYTH58741 [Nymphaea thermarum]